MSSDLRLRLACIAIGYIISVLVLVIAHIPETTLAPPVAPVVAPPVAPPVAPVVAPPVAPPRLRGGGSDEMGMGDIIRLLSGFVHTTHRLFLSLPRATEKDIWAAYASEVERTLVPFDRRFRGRTLFPVRDDDSMFVSIASYRDGQLAHGAARRVRPRARARAPARRHRHAELRGELPHRRAGPLPGRELHAQDGGARRRARALPDRARGRHPLPSGTPSSAPTPRSRATAARARCGCSPSTRPSRSARRWRATSRPSSGRARRTSCRSTRTRGSPTSGTRSSSRCAARAERQAGALAYPPAAGARGRAARRRPAHVRERVLQVARRGVDRAARRVAALPDARRDAADADAAPVPYAPFVAAGFFVAPARFLAEVPFDPFLPWVFMGEEISLSTRLWTHGWDIFAPPTNVVAHEYRPGPSPAQVSGERSRGVFNRPGFNTPLMLLVIERVKSMVGYPESAPARLADSSVLAHLDDYGLGTLGAAARGPSRWSTSTSCVLASRGAASWCRRRGDAALLRVA